MLIPQLCTVWYGAQLREKDLGISPLRVGLGQGRDARATIQRLSSAARLALYLWANFFLRAPYHGL
jgi:hypothetical protein